MGDVFVQVIHQDLGANIESKYAFRPEHGAHVLEWLEDFCVRDPDFYHGSIASLYFDTPILNLYEEKRGSDYVKTKLRLRWYQDPVEGLSHGVRVPCYLEVKRKFGAVRWKRRMPMELDSDTLLDAPFDSEEVLNLPWVAYGLAPMQPGDYVPAAVIEYTRHRFLEIETGARISVDTRIACRVANDQLFRNAVEAWLPLCVLEVKGKSRRLPEVLRPLSLYLRKEAFSKYALCIETMNQPMFKHT